MAFRFGQKYHNKIISSKIIFCVQNREMFSKMKKKMMPGKKFYSKYLLCIQTRKSKKMFQKCFEKK